MINTKTGYLDGLYCFFYLIDRDNYREFNQLGTKFSLTLDKDGLLFVESLNGTPLASTFDEQIILAIPFDFIYSECIQMLPSDTKLNLADEKVRLFHYKQDITLASSISDKFFRLAVTIDKELKEGKKEALAQLYKARKQTLFELFNK